MSSSSIGLIGLAAMGANLSRNFADKGFKVTVYNRTQERTDKFIEKYKNENLIPAYSLEELVETLEKPRKIILMVKAGSAVEILIESLIPLLDPEDIIIECGNSYYKDSQKRAKKLATQKIHYIDCGVSGGEEGALKGPSLMPAGDKKAYEQIKPLLEKIAAKDFENNPCVSYIGAHGAGHFVKMVHNGIEYSIMQQISEIYDILRKIYSLSPDEIADIFKTLNNNKLLKSYLFEIAPHVLTKKDDLNHGNLIDHILDKAKQKGTGAWTSIDAFERGICVSSISEAVSARVLSGEKDLRTKLHQIYNSQEKKEKINQEKFIKLLEDGLFASIITAYAQGFNLIKKASEEENWQINLAETARIWQGGCIIRADLLKKIQLDFQKFPNISHIYEMPEIIEELKKSIEPLKEITTSALKQNIPIPSLTSSLNYFFAFTSSHLPANLIQALRDFFGAHSYERIDKEGLFHTEWKE